MQIVHFHQSNSGGVTYAAHDRGVVACWQVCYDRRFSCVTRGVAAGLDFLNLVVCDNPADDGSLPVIIRGKQSASAIMQFQGWISHWIGNSILTELRANGAYDHSLCSRTLYDESSDHHIIAGLDKTARADIS